jgi:hypothetical protein
MIREELFEEAKRLFGSESIITASVQNEGSIKNQEDAETIFRETQKVLFSKKQVYQKYCDDVVQWWTKLRDACIEGKIY